MMQRRNLFIAIEGLDGAGKTTVATLVAERIEGTYMKSPPNEYRAIIRDIEKYHDAHMKFFLYSAANLHFARLVEEVLKQQPVVADRYIYSTLAYYRSRGIDVGSLCLKKFLSPDKIFYLHADDKVLFEREMKRGSVEEDFFSDRRIKRREKIRNNYDNMELEKIDTTSLGIEEVVTIILQHLA